MSRQDEDVLGAVAEWGNDQRNDVEPVEKVFAESAILDRVFERSIGRATIRTLARRSFDSPSRS